MLILMCFVCSVGLCIGMAMERVLLDLEMSLMHYGCMDFVAFVVCLCERVF